MGQRVEFVVAERDDKLAADDPGAALLFIGVNHAGFECAAERFLGPNGLYRDSVAKSKGVAEERADAVRGNIADSAMNQRS